MPRITLKETITRKIEIPMDALCGIIDNLTEEERKTILKRLTKKQAALKPFKKDMIESILADFASTSLYEEDFLKDLEDGLKKSSVYK
jgi:hypothetical protein